MKKRILAISLSVAVLLVSLTVAGMLTVTADTTIAWKDGLWPNDPNLVYLDGTRHYDVGQIAPVEPGTYNASENLIYRDETNPSLLTDGLLYGDESTEEGVAWGNYHIAPGHFQKMTYDLGSEATIGRFLVAGGYYGVPLIKVYASSTDSTPGDDEDNLVVSIAGAFKEANQDSRAFWLRPVHEVKARYVTFSIYSISESDCDTMVTSACSGYGALNGWRIDLSEFAIIGSKLIKNVEKTPTSVKTYDELSDNMKHVLDNNILTADKFSSCHNYAGTYKSMPANFDKLFDGNVFDTDVSLAFSDDASADPARQAVWYDFNLGQATEISSVLLAAGQNFGVEGFDVYVVNTVAADIIANPGKYVPVYSYTDQLGTDNMNYWPKLRDNSSVLVEFGELPVGSHLIVKLVSSLNGGKWTTTYLSEIAAVGGVAPIENKGAQVRANDGTLADLRFVFELNASGVAFGEGVYRTIAEDASVFVDDNLYTLKGYGAVVSLDGDAIALDKPLTNDAVKQVEAEKLYEVKTENKEVIYTVVVTDVPDFDKNIYARAYVDYQKGNDVIRVYDEVIVKTVNGVESAAVNDGEVSDAEVEPAATEG